MTSERIVGRPRTLGDARGRHRYDSRAENPERDRERDRAQGRPGQYSSDPRTNDHFAEAMEGSDFEDPSTDGLQKLLAEQNRELSAAEEARSSSLRAERERLRAEEPPLESAARPPRRGENVRETVQELPPGRRGGTRDDGTRDENATPVEREEDAITNRVSGPQAPPPITPLQAQARLQRDASEDKLGPAPDRPLSKPRFIIKEPNRAPEYFRVELLSGFIFYPWKDVQVRRINLIDQAKIHIAQETRDLTLLIDAVGATLSEGVDIRDLSVPDFFYLLYWHRLRSYTTIPFIVTWTSKYGNRNEYRIVETDLKYNEPTITDADYAAWQAKGFQIPTVRDYEVFARETLNVEERFLFDRAQYFKGYTNDDGVVDIEGKINAMNDLCAESLGVLGELPAFKVAIEHSVNETLQLTDALFDAPRYVQTLEAHIEGLKTLIESAVSDPLRFVTLNAELAERQVELETLTTQIAQGGKVLPDVEDVTLNLHPLDFFPRL